MAKKKNIDKNIMKYIFENEKNKISIKEMVKNLDIKRRKLYDILNVFKGK